MREHRLTRLFVAAALTMGATVALTVAATPSTVSALRTYVVTSTSDAPWNGTPGVCASTAPLAPCTLRAAIDLAAADFAVANFDDITIDLAQLDRGATIALTGPLTIPNMLGRRVTISAGTDPSERVVLRGNGSFRLLEYNGGPSDSLEIIGLALQDGGNVAEGGALLASGDVTLRNVEATSNEALDGGAVLVSGWNARVYDSVFNGNEAQGGQGGAIKATFTTLVVERTSFVDNYAYDQGGAIWMQGRLNTAPIVRQSTFRSNDVAINEGSAIYCASCDPFNSNTVLEAVSILGGTGNPSAAVDSDGNVIATNVTFVDNAGPAIHANGGALTHTTITGNGTPAITATGASGPPIGQFSRRPAASSTVSCAGPAVQVAAGRVRHRHGRLRDHRWRRGARRPGVVRRAVRRDGVGIRTGDGDTLPVLVMTEPATASRRAADPIDARGWTRGDDVRPRRRPGRRRPAGRHVHHHLGRRQPRRPHGRRCVRRRGRPVHAARRRDGGPGLPAGRRRHDRHGVRAATTRCSAPTRTAPTRARTSTTARCGGLELTTDLRVLGPPDATQIPPIVRATGPVFRTNGTELLLERLDLVGGEVVGNGGVVEAVLDGTANLTIRDSALRNGRAPGRRGRRARGERCRRHGDARARPDRTPTRRRLEAAGSPSPGR